MIILEKKIIMVHEDHVTPTVLENGTCARLVTNERENSEHVSFHISRLQSSTWSKERISQNADEAIYLITGEAEVVFDGKLHQWPVGGCLYIPAGQKYRYHAKTHLVVAVIKSPPMLRTDLADVEDLVVLEPEDALQKH